MFETAQRQTLHVGLPTLFQFISNLKDQSDGKEVWQGFGNAMAHALVHSRKL